MTPWNLKANKKTLKTNKPQNKQIGSSLRQDFLKGRSFAAVAKFQF